MLHGHGNLPHTRGDEPDYLEDAFRLFFDLPHTRGDEPYIEALTDADIAICPTRVGMNRNSATSTRPTLKICPTRVGMNRIRQHGQHDRPQSAPHAWG